MFPGQCFPRFSVCDFSADAELPPRHGYGWAFPIPAESGQRTWAKDQQVPGGHWLTQSSSSLDCRCVSCQYTHTMYVRMSILNYLTDPRTRGTRFYGQDFIALAKELQENVFRKQNSMVLNAASHSTSIYFYLCIYTIPTYTHPPTHPAHLPPFHFFMYFFWFFVFLFFEEKIEYCIESLSWSQMCSGNGGHVLASHPAGQIVASIKKRTKKISRDPDNGVEPGIQRQLLGSALVPKVAFNFFGHGFPSFYYLSQFQFQFLVSLLQFRVPGTYPWYIHSPQLSSAPLCSVSMAFQFRGHFLWGLRAEFGISLLHPNPASGVRSPRSGLESTFDFNLMDRSRVKSTGFLAFICVALISATMLQMFYILKDTDALLEGAEKDTRRSALNCGRKLSSLGCATSRGP